MCVCALSCVLVRACAMFCMGVLFFFITSNVFISPGTVMITKNFKNYSAR